MSSKERNEVNLAQSVSQFLSTTTDPTQQGFAICWVWGCQLELEEVLCRAGCTATGHIGLEVPVSTGGFVQSQVSGKGQDKKHLTPWLFLPATSSNSGWEMCSWGNNNQAYQGTNSSRHSQCRCPTNYSPPGQNRFYSINDP